MQEFSYVLSEYEEINSLLYKPINSTQRIKYTCFNTSTNYIVLGSTSGSIYLFSRKPCSFLQLIPLSEGAVSRVLISPDEKTIALATARGSVCLIALKPMPKLIAVSTEHIYEQVNCLCWNDNSSEIYIGDGAGKVSVMVLSIFTVNGMFQAPACTLMNLDSSVVQLSFSSPLLVVSTLARCYICDTIREQYKQIGNKARNGEFGACFYKTSLGASKSTLVTQKEEKLVNKKRSFNFIPEGDNNIEEENFCKIFCARPGSRLWEVSANGIVMKTHQFKEALAIPPITICKSKVRRLNEKKEMEQIWAAQSINFSHLYVITDKYLLSYTSNGLYIIDPESATVILWNNEFTNIVMVETIENRIYLMTTDGEFHCLVLITLDCLLLQLYTRKRYNECLDVCLLYKLQLQNLISETEVHKICDIESKLHVLKDDELSTTLHPIILLLQSNFDTCPKKLDSGIVVVHSGNSGTKDEETFRYKSASRNHSSTMREVPSDTDTSSELEVIPLNSTLIESTEENNENEDANCNSSAQLLANSTGEDLTATKADLNPSNDTTHKVQHDLEAIYTVANNIRLTMNEKELEEIIVDLDQRINTIKLSYETLTELKNFLYEVIRSAELYYFNVLLENTSVQLIRSARSDYVMNQLTKAFVNLNMQSSSRCICGYPCPMSQLTEPKFLMIGRSILKKFIDENKEECLSLCNKVPYMWREYLSVYDEQQDVQVDSNELLRQCLQTRDNVILSFLLPRLEEKEWDLVATYLIEMKESRCLFCGRITRKLNEPLIDWSGIIKEISSKQGPDIAMAVFLKLEKAIPNVSVDKSIFQSLVFTKILHHHGMKHTVDFNKSTLHSSEYNTICSTKVRDQLIEVLEKDLGRSINKNVFGNGAHHWGMRYKKNKTSTCPCCTLSLQTPVLLGNNGIAIFCCGHAYHVNCMIEKKLTTCNLHT